MVVVSHFDYDHWGGLIDLAGLVASRGRVEPIQLLYPRLPRPAQNVPVGALALMSLHTPGVERPQRVIDAWRAHGLLEARSMREGDWFEAVGRAWQVHWPPKVVGTDVTRAASAALEDLQALADDLRSQDYPALQESLERLHGWPSIPDDDRPRNPLQGDDDVFEGVWAPLGGDGDLFEGDGDARPLGAFVRAAAMGTIPDDPEVINTCRSLDRRLQRLNNYFSLVMDCGPEFAAFGDIEKGALRYLVRSGRLQSRYVALLAPHHGTHPVPAGFPVAEVCLMQDGPAHAQRHAKHLDTHVSAECVGTDRLGNQTVYFPCGI